MSGLGVTTSLGRGTLAWVSCGLAALASCATQPSAAAPSNAARATAPPSAAAASVCYANAVNITLTMRRTLDPGRRTIKVEWFDHGERSIPTELYTVDGNRFSDAEHATGRLRGPAWHWTAWTTTVATRTVTMVITETVTPLGLTSHVERRFKAGTADIHDTIWHVTECREPHEPDPKGLVDI
jgi:hypothetical protein